MDCFKASIPVLKTLCDETRLHIMSMLSQAEMNACEIQKAFCCTQPTISYHMRQLVENQLVLARREGAQVLYTVNQQLWPSIQALLTALCRAYHHREECLQSVAQGESQP